MPCERDRRFEALAVQVPHTARRGLVLEHKLEAPGFEALQWYVRAYISACCSSSGPVLSEAQILERLNDDGTPLLNRTPNGVLMPKYEFSMEYNSLHRSLVKIMEGIGFDSLADSWQLPIIVRAVAGKPQDPKAPLRPYATTKIHSDVWAGEPSDLVLLNLPVFGDIEKTTLRWFQSSEEPGENFLKTLDDFSEGDGMVQQAFLLDLVPKQGHLYFSDATVLQQILQGSGGPQVSIDLRVRMKTSPQEKKWAEAQARSKCLEQYVSWETFRRVGHHAIVVFEDRYASLKQNPAPSFSRKYLLFDFGR